MEEQKKNPAQGLSESEQVQVRRQKLADLQAAGNDPFALTKFPQDAYSADLKEEFKDLPNETDSGKKVALAGRLMSKRVMGKASFAHLRDDKGDIQLYVRRDELGDEAYAAFKKLDVGDIIGVIHNTLRGVPIDLRELALEERDNGDNLRRSMQSGSISVEQALGTYHDEYHRSFHESDSGRRFEDAFQVIVTDEGRREIDEAVRDIAQNPYLEGEPGILLAQVRAELKRIYEGIEDVRRQIRISDEAVSRLVRQQTDTHYCTMLDKLHRLFVRASDDAKTHPGSDERPYRTDTGTAQFQALPSRPAKSMARAATAGLDDAPSTNVDAPDLKAMVEMCGPRLTHMIGLIRRDPVKTADGRFVDFAASFNRLPREERRESELIGFLSALRTQDGPATVAWHCVSIDGGERVWRTRPILTTETALDEIIEEG